MKTLPRNESEKLFDKYWDEMKSEFFKVEVLQDYAAEEDDKSLDVWLAGDKIKSIELLKQGRQGWVSKRDEKTEQNVKLLRFHIIEEPLTPYMEWEIEHYKQINIPIWGEVVYLINRSDIETKVKLPDGDFMIFDSKRVILNSYNEKGRVVSRTFYGENDDITNFLTIRNVLINSPKSRQLASQN